MNAIKSTPKKEIARANEEAVIQGETHFSSNDRQALMELDLSSFHAVFREDSVHHFFERKLTIGYTLFVIGYILYGATFGRFYHSPEDFEKKVRDADIPFYKIDADAPTIYEMTSRKNRIFLIIGSPFIALFTTGFLLVGLGRVLNVFGVTLPAWVSILGGLIFLFTFGLVWPLVYFILVIDETMDERDEYMANRILEHSAENGFEHILVSCGDAHRKGISNRLKVHGWVTDPRPTKSRIGRAVSYFDRLSQNLLKPIHYVNRAVAWMTSNRG